MKRRIAALCNGAFSRHRPTGQMRVLVGLREHMTKSATDVMQDAPTAAFVDAVPALKAASNGLPNALLRDLNAIHPNTAASDLRTALRDAIANGVRLTFTQLKKEGYVVVDAKKFSRARPVQVTVRRGGAQAI